MKNLSTRSKLILLVVVPALPALALTLYSAFEERAPNLAGIALATILLLLGAWYGTEVFVLRNIRTLLDTARRVRSGDLGARTGLHREKDELNQVGREFDEMAETLQRRDLELKKAMQELQEQAITDPLTGLHNTRYLRELLPRELLRARRTGTMPGTKCSGSSARCSRRASAAATSPAATAARSSRSFWPMPLPRARGAGPRTFARRSSAWS